MIIPVILSGGAGTRLWPLSRPEHPKQFLSLTAEATMFELTLERVIDDPRFADPVIVAGAHHADMVEAQLAGRPATLILEPLARNTAPAIALAALVSEGVILVMPSDHVIADVPAFMAAIEAAMPLVHEGWLVTFGITPNAPETGYGYIQVGDAVVQDVHRVARFVEKPPREAAQAMLESGDYAWNSGIFLFRTDAFLGALADHAPDIVHSAQSAVAASTRSGRRIMPDENAFAQCPSDSIDYAVMEKAKQVAVVRVNMGWSDIGSWDALYDVSAKGVGGNVISGDVTTIESQNNLIKSDGLRISVSGVHDLIIIASGQDVMIIPRGKSQDVKAIVRAIS